MVVNFLLQTIGIRKSNYSDMILDQVRVSVSPTLIKVRGSMIGLGGKGCRTELL